MPSSLHAADVALRAVFAGVQHVSLHTADPGRVGHGEIVGGAYRRQATIFGAPQNGAVKNTATLYFENMPESKPTHFGVWSGGGHFLWGGVLRPDGEARTLTPVHAGNTVMVRVGVIQIVME